MLRSEIWSFEKENTVYSSFKKIQYTDVCRECLEFWQGKYSL